MPEDRRRPPRPGATSCSRSPPGCSPSKGFKNTTVRDIADAAGILSGSLYHHFDSKESMVDEILQHLPGPSCSRRTTRSLGQRRRRAGQARARSCGVSFEAIDQHHDEVAIFQNDADYLGTLRAVRLPRRAQRAVPRGVDRRCSSEGVASGALRADLDVELVYRFIRDTVWVAVRWYRPGGELTARRRSPTSTSPSSSTGSQHEPSSLRPTSSTPSAPRSASAAARSPACTPPTSARTC